MISTVVAMSQQRAEALKPKKIGRHTAILSITNPHHHPAALPDGFDHQLRVRFNYVPGSFRTGNDNGPTPEVIGSIVDFLERLHQDSNPIHLVVHCGEGRFRSMAVAAFAECYYDAAASSADPSIQMGMGSMSLFRDLSHHYDRHLQQDGKILAS